MANNADAIDLMNEVHGARHIVKVLTNKVAELEKKNERLRAITLEQAYEIGLLKGRIEAALALL